MDRVLLAALFFLSFSACRVSENGGNASTRSSVNEPRAAAAGFSLPSVTGGTVSLSELKGKVVLIDFWATWCGPCVYKIPAFINLKNKYAKDGFEIIGLSVDRGRSQMTGFIREKGINYPIVYADAELQEKYGGIRGIPTTFFIDKKGRIAEKVVGGNEEIFFDKKIKDLLMEEE
ncbi:MAG: TlpA family protein disulfide reductase [Elusimicrobia bacterium HGW-Elusimicrobia-2]|nr:MAG: TlpA family protein disulfide reductase [Elusimicrobia bacterium HGW-Elusimicrobia-2]